MKCLGSEWTRWSIRIILAVKRLLDKAVRPGPASVIGTTWSSEESRSAGNRAADTPLSSYRWLPGFSKIFRKAAMNYRSAVVFGTAIPVESSEEKLRVLRAFSEHLIKGRWQEVRSPSPSELKREPSKVDLDLGESSEAAVDAACRAGSPWPEKLGSQLV